MRTPLAISLAVLGLVLAAAGCGGASNSTPGDDAREEPARQAEDAIGVSTAGWETDFTRHSVPLSEFESGGPSKDGIPSIDEPKFVPPAEADEWLEAREPVIELVVEGEARAYPIQILMWHEIVNDDLGGTPVAVTFCPLCNTALVFDRRLDGRVLEFGTTGNLRNSDLVMYDRETESWWQQFGGEALVGELTGSELEQLPARVVAWEEFARAHPDGRVLSRDTGFSRAYGQNPYTGYDSVDSPPFFGAQNDDDDRLQPKERVVFVERGDDALVVPFSVLEQKRKLEVEVGGEQLEVVWRPGVRSSLDERDIAEGREVGSAEVRDAETGELVPFDTPFWFAVAAFRPDVTIEHGS